MGVKIHLDVERTKRLKACFVDEARRILAERKRTTATLTEKKTQAIKK